MKVLFQFKNLLERLDLLYQQIFFYKGLTRNPEIGNTPVWALPNIWRLGQVMDTKFGTNVSNKLLLNATKFQGYSFYRFWVIEGKPTAGKITPPPPPTTQVRVRGTNADLKISLYVCLHMKIICSRFHIETPFAFWVIRTWDMWNFCLQTFENNRIC